MPQLMRRKQNADHDQRYDDCDCSR
jgi:hypothetical protein